jgi:hypothetical protein
MILLGPRKLTEGKYKDKLQSFGKWYFRNMHSAVAAQKKE